MVERPQVVGKRVEEYVKDPDGHVNDRRQRSCPVAPIPNDHFVDVVSERLLRQ